MAERTVSPLRREKEKNVFTRELFIPLLHELSIIEGKMVDIGVKGSTGKPLVEFVGPRGMGKSWFLYDLAQRNWPEIEGKLPKVIYTDLTHFDGRKKQELTTKASSATRDVKTTIPVFIFDHTDQSEDKDLKWLEDKIVFPFIQNDNNLFVTGGQKKLFWEHYEVRRRVDTCEMQSFNQQMTSDQLGLLDILGSESSQIVQRLTQGIPGLTSRLMQKLGRPNSDKHWSERGLEEVRKAVDEYYLPKGNLSKRLAWDISVMRSFHTQALRSFASRMDSGYKDKPDGFYLDKIQEMIDCGLVEWNSDKGGYAMQPSIQRLMRANFEDNKPGEVVDLHKHAASLYIQFLGEFPESVESWLLKIFYHGVQMVRIGGMSKEDFGRQWSETTDQYLARYQNNQKAKEHLRLASEAIRQDEEMQQALEQISMSF